MDDCMVRTPGKEIPIAKKCYENGTCLYEFKNPRTGKKEKVPAAEIGKMFGIIYPDVLRK